MADRLPSVASGARTTVAGIASTRLKVDMANVIYDYEGMGAPLYTTLSMLGKEQAINKTVAWHVDELVPKFARINGGISNGATDTTFTVDSPMGSYVGVGWLIQFTRTGETCLTTTGGSATSIVVTARSWGNVAAGTIVDNDEILILGPAYGEAATLGSAITTTETQYTNTLQTVRNNWSIGGLMEHLSKNGGVYGPEETARQREKMIAYHKRGLEQVVMFSEAATSGSTSTAYGLIPWAVRYASGNVNSATVLTEPVFEAGNATWFRAGESDKRVLMCARPVHGIINQFAAARQVTQSGQKDYGLRIRNYESAHGDISLVRTVSLEGDEYSKYAVGFDPTKVKLKMGRDCKLLKNRQGTSVDSYEEEIISDLAGVWGLPESVYIWTDIAA